MIGASGSTLWLLGHETRLMWRGLMGARTGRVQRGAVFSILAVLMLLVGVPTAWGLRRVGIPINPLSILVADAVATLAFTLMLSQTLAAATEALYTRGDLDLLFSSPVEPRRILTVRFLALAGGAFTTFAIFVAPFVLPAALFGHWRWLGVLVELAALALAASGLGLALAVGLFALIGARRTRTVAQVMAAVIGAAFFLASQMPNILGHRSTVWTRIFSLASRPGLHLPTIASWPLRAGLGEPLPLAVVVLAGVGLFLAVSAWLSRRFAADAAAAQGADLGRSSAKTKTTAVFVGGAFAATVRKELRLLGRDIALLSQVFLRVLYLIPVSLVLLRGAGGHTAYVLPGGAAALAFLAGQVAASLTWITVSAEDAPELLACAPAPTKVVRDAKLFAALSPLAALLAIPLVALTVIAPITGLAATLGAAASAWASAQINVWYQKPGKRSEFRRRRAASWIASLSQFFVTLCIASATALVAVGSVWTLGLALVPAILAIAALAVLHRSDAQIAEAVAAEG